MVRKEGSKLFKKPMKMRDLEVWGVPSYIVDIWEKSYSTDLLPVQEKAVRDYGILDYEEGRGNDRNRDCRVAALLAMTENTERQKKSVLLSFFELFNSKDV
jgi:hypothetical protein